MKWLLKIGGAAGAIVAIAAAWHLFGAPVPAWSSDIRKLDARQAETAIDVYSKAVRDDTILMEQITKPQSRAVIQERLEYFKNQLKNARDRKIELSK